MIGDSRVYQQSMKFIVDEVSVPFEEEMEDFDEMDGPQANNDNPAPIEDNDHLTNFQLEEDANHKTWLLEPMRQPKMHHNNQ